MSTLLRIDSSARLTRSITRELADRFLDAWRSVDPDTRVVTRDVGQNPPPPVNEDWIRAAFVRPEKRTQEMHRALAISEELIDEVQQADVLLISAPLYNYGLPASLKGWVDQVVRIGRVFSFDLDRGDFPIESEFSGKSMVVLSSRGEFGFELGEPRDGWNHLNPHLRTIATRLLGIVEQDIHEIASEYQEFGGDRHRASREAAYTEAVLLGEQLAAARKSARGGHKVTA